MNVNALKRYILRLKMSRAYTSNDLEKTIRYAKEYLRNNEVDEIALWLLLDSSFRRMDYEEAENYASRLLSIRPDHTEALQKLSIIYFEKEEYSRAYSLVSHVVDSSDSSTEIDRLLNDMETNRFFSGLARNVRSALGDDRLENKEWLEWALRFKRWYEKDIQSKQTISPEDKT